MPALFSFLPGIGKGKYSSCQEATASPKRYPLIGFPALPRRFSSQFSGCPAPPHHSLRPETNQYTSAVQGPTGRAVVGKGSNSPWTQCEPTSLCSLCRQSSSVSSISLSAKVNTHTHSHKKLTPDPVSRGLVPSTSVTPKVPQDEVQPCCAQARGWGQHLGWKPPCGLSCYPPFLSLSLLCAFTRQQWLHPWKLKCVSVPLKGAVNLSGGGQVLWE